MIRQRCYNFRRWMKRRGNKTHVGGVVPPNKVIDGESCLHRDQSSPAPSEFVPGVCRSLACGRGRKMKPSWRLLEKKYIRQNSQHREPRVPAPKEPPAICQRFAHDIRSFVILILPLAQWSLVPKIVELVLRSNFKRARRKNARDIGCKEPNRLAKDKNGDVSP